MADAIRFQKSGSAEFVDTIVVVENARSPTLRCDLRSAGGVTFLDSLYDCYPTNANRVKNPQLGHT